MRTQKRKCELKGSLYMAALGINKCSRELQKAKDEGRTEDAERWQKDLTEFMTQFQNDLCIAFDDYIGNNKLKD